MTVDAPARRRRRRVEVGVTGTVQGVGFRPYVYRLAAELGLSGFVLNDATGVKLEAEGEEPAVADFLRRLGQDAPPLAVLERLEVRERPLSAERGFVIRTSRRGERADAAITPDTATCADCLAELFDAHDRRFRYPFINCTNCGPRFTIVRGVPYDRPFTTMADFAMCSRCRHEYDDPADRRFHAQPNACPICGPLVSLLDGQGGVAALDRARDPVQAAAQALRAGAIVAVKGIGGYHLACRADDQLAVSKLRSRKHREDKPFALMVADEAMALGLTELTASELELMRSAPRPIVLGRRRAGSGVAEEAAPGVLELGVMLPYSPLHHLLLADAEGPLVMTSGNISDEPIAHDDDDARERLAGLADLFLVHDRPIETRTDDSVVREVRMPFGPRTVFLRRSRGYVPGALALPGGTRCQLLACGAELKNTFCLARGDHAWVSHHIGDLENYATLRSFTAGIEHFQRLFAVAPEVVVHDLHPEYLSTKYALEREGVELIGVQHHHAHLAAALAEHGEPGPALGIIFDGSGYGTDATIWGGEFLFGDRADFARVGKLWPVRLAGGERAIREPWRMACAWLAASGIRPAAPPRLLSESVPEPSWRAVGGLLSSGLASPPTSSVGRLFDAVGALCGLRSRVNYEGQAAIELEQACDPRERGRYPIAVSPGADGLVLDPREMIAGIAADLEAGISPARVASRFHAGLASGVIGAAEQLAGQCQTGVVVLSGGVFQNRRLLETVGAGLIAAGLRVIIPQRLPLGDGGIAYGQAAVAAQRLAEL